MYNIYMLKISHISTSEILKYERLLALINDLNQAYALYLINKHI